MFGIKLFPYLYNLNQTTMKIKITNKQIEFMNSLDDKMARDLYHRALIQFNGDDERILKYFNKVLDYQKKKLALLKK